MRMLDWKFGDVLRSKATGSEIILTRAFVAAFALKNVKPGFIPETTKRLTMERIRKQFTWVRRPPTAS